MMRRLIEVEGQDQRRSILLCASGREAWSGFGLVRESKKDLEKPPRCPEAGNRVGSWFRTLSFEECTEEARGDLGSEAQDWQGSRVCSTCQGLGARD